MASLLLVMFLFITCSKDDNIVAQYSLSIEVTPAEGGSVSPAVGSFDEGVSKTITATPVEGWEFVGWSGDITSVENPLTLTMDEIKNITAVFQPILYNKIIGKWDVNNLSSKLSSKNSSSKKDDTNSSKTTDGDCIVYSLVFNSDGTFILSLSSGEIQGAFYFDSVNSITLTNVGTLTNLSITSGTITFNLSLTNLCSIDGYADNDSDYEEGECFFFKL